MHRSALQVIFAWIVILAWAVSFITYQFMGRDMNNAVHGMALIVAGWLYRDALKRNGDK